MGSSRDISAEADYQIEQNRRAAAAAERVGMPAIEERYTHNKKGGQYRMLGAGKYKRDSSKEWQPAIFYQEVTTGALYSTGPQRWNDAFSIMPGPGCVQQDAPNNTTGGQGF